MGAANAIFMLSEITTGAEKEAYKNLALDNIYYNLGEEEKYKELEFM